MAGLAPANNRIIMKHYKLALFCLPLLFSACGTTKRLSQEDSKSVQEIKQEAAVKSHGNSSFDIVQKVYDTKVATENIVADMTFSATLGDKDVSVPGSIHMRKGQIIRLQLFIPILHTEVGRLEFTPDYVLVVDRIHKQYVKEDYNKLDFLRANGLNFYSLQALFWNQLFLPGTDNLEENNLQNFKASSDGQNISVGLTRGNMSYTWTANSLSGMINNAIVKYASNSNSSTLTWKYSDYKPVGSKKFPAYEEFSFQTTATKKSQNLKVVLDMDDIETSSKWNTETTISPKYKKIEATDIFGKLFNNM